ncbi:hypothetical protein CXF85_07855 [Colwellia sp. 75C3]|uniref:hypothetical protein n=1 Tax=Colwellia sp. 75C3 TaxID=888425 RepID=UPI000C31EED3|nr:hypothetical protein [Colwellia sp. 75C3]PKG84669.1 hypothetical protein CXF85_07855 [Colwellia sp. 75C3]
MLINTVLVFLQNILPIFVVFSLLFAQQGVCLQLNKHSKFQSIHQKSDKTFDLTVSKVVKTTIIGLFLIGSLSHYMPILSQHFAGMGLEIVFSILFSLIYCLITTSFLLRLTSSHHQWHDKPINEQQTLNRQQTFISLAILLLVLCVHGSYFSLYVRSLLFSKATIEASYSGIVVGVIIGTGICLSIAILLYFILMTLDKKLKGKMVYYFLLLFGVAQLMQGLQLLEQVDIISSNVHLWSTSHLIAEDSELGYFLTILFGYEATPSAMQLIVYLSAIILPIIIAKLISHRQNTTASLMKGTY